MCRCVTYKEIEGKKYEEISMRFSSYIGMFQRNVWIPTSWGGVIRYRMQIYPFKPLIEYVTLCT